MRIGSLDDLESPGSRARDGLLHLRSLITRIGEDCLDEREALPRLAQDVARAVAVLDAVGVNDHAQQKAERVDEDVTLASNDLLPRVITLRVQARAPF